MSPHDFRSRLRSKLIALGERKPRNLDDLVLSEDTLARERAIVRSSDRKRPEAPRELEFANGARLRLQAVFECQDRIWEMTEYSFHFATVGSWFRYDRDPDAASGQAHPLDHLHVGKDEPRFPTGGQDLLRLVDFLDEQLLI